MNRFHVTLAIILQCFLNIHLSWAVPAFVTDSFKITFRSGRSNESKVLAMLPSGQAVEIVGSSGDWSRVLLSQDGESKEGWVLTRYLISRVPWETKAHFLMNENTALKEKLAFFETKSDEHALAAEELTVKLEKKSNAFETLKQKFESLKTRSSQYLALESKYKDSQSRLETAEKQIQRLDIENKKMRSLKRRKWFATGAAVLLSGTMIGLVLARRQRKRRSSFYF